MAVARRLNAFLFLGYRAIVVHPLKALFQRGQHGSATFLKNYGPDGLVPLSTEERAKLTSYMRCVNCGLCDQVCPLVGKLDRRDFAGPSPIAVAWTRATPDLTAIAAPLRHLPEACGSCTKCVEICPTRVPLKELFVYANKKLVEVEAAKAGTLSATLQLPPRR